MVKIPTHIQTLQPYVAGKPIDELAREKKLTRIVKLASNENPLGPSPKALAAVSDALKQISRYVDPSSFLLVRKLAETLGKKPQQIICGAGVDALLGYIVKTFSEVGDEVLTSAGTFIGIYVNTKKHDRSLSLVPLKNYHYDLDGIRAAITERTRVIYLANPNNPTGTIFTSSEFERFMSRVPREILVVLDEAYFTYAEANSEYPNGLDYHYENLIVTRTFSKDYGLAGLRVGYAVGPDPLISELYKVKLPFEPNFLAQEAARAALDDVEFLRKTVTLNERSLTRMTKRFAELGIRYIATDANFILMLMPNEQFAVEFNQSSLDRGLIIRHVRTFGIPEGIRINSGTEEETTFALDIIEDVYTQLCKSSPHNLAGQSRG